MIGDAYVWSSAAPDDGKIKIVGISYPTMELLIYDKITQCPELRKGIQFAEMAVYPSSRGDGCHSLRLKMD